MFISFTSQCRSVASAHPSVSQGGNLSWMWLELLFVIFMRLPERCVPYTEVTTLSSLF